MRWLKYQWVVFNRSMQRDPAWVYVMMVIAASMVGYLRIGGYIA